MSLHLKKIGLTFTKEGPTSKTIQTKLMKKKRMMTSLTPKQPILMLQLKQKFNRKKTMKTLSADTISSTKKSQIHPRLLLVINNLKMPRTKKMLLKKVKRINHLVRIPTKLRTCLAQPYKRLGVKESMC